MSTGQLRYDYNGSITLITGPMFSGKCFARGTTLKTPFGNVPVESIMPGDTLICGDGLSGQVYDRYTCMQSTCVEIIESDDNKHVVNAEHLVPIIDRTGRRQVIRAFDLVNDGTHRDLATYRVDGTRRFGLRAEITHGWETIGIAMEPSRQLIVLGCGTVTHNSSALTDTLERYRIARMRILLLRPECDKRYDEKAIKGGIVLHNEREYAKCRIMKCSQLTDVSLDTILQYDVIGVDEITLYPDVLTTVEWANMGRIVVACGLNGSYRMENFGGLHLLIPHCDKIIHQTAVCIRCGKDAPFTMRTSESKNLVEIGGDDKYVAVCRKCWYMMNKN